MLRKYYFFYVLEENKVQQNVLSIMGKVLHRVTGSSILPLSSFRCMLTLKFPEEAQQSCLIEVGRGGRDVYRKLMNFSTYSSNGPHGNQTPQAPIQPERISKQHT